MTPGDLSRAISNAEKYGRETVTIPINDLRDLLAGIETVHARGVDRGIRLAAQLITDHNIHGSETLEKASAFLIARADRVSTGVNGAEPTT